MQFTLDHPGAPHLQEGKQSKCIKSDSQKGAKLFVTLIDN